MNEIVLLWYGKRFLLKKTCSDGTFMAQQMIFLEGNRAPTVIVWFRKLFFSKKNVLRRSFYGAVNVFLSAENVLRWYFDGAVDDFSQTKTCFDGPFMVS